jgi:S1-C subfamily serine protease
MGDIIRKVNGQAVRNTRDLQTLSKQDFRLWRLEIQRDGQLIKTTIS